uniref:Uncharacterized protein n=1 Tax=Arundo donax TaxID=35708 RepID=A0A0A9HNM2_ARUDO
MVYKGKRVIFHYDEGKSHHSLCVIKMLSRE